MEALRALRQVSSDLSDAKSLIAMSKTLIILSCSVVSSFISLVSSSISFEEPGIDPALLPLIFADLSIILEVTL